MTQLTERAPTRTQAKCGTCRRIFGGVTGFDRHRRNGLCVDPVTFGYVERGGVWRKPTDGPAIERRRAARPAAATVERRTGAGAYPNDPPASQTGSCPSLSGRA
jgi:hypothetical protein